MPLQDPRKIDWVAFEWGQQGGRQARQLAMWVQLQREFYRRNVLGPKAIRRLDAIGFKWTAEQVCPLLCIH